MTAAKNAKEIDDLKAKIKILQDENKALKTDNEEIKNQLESVEKMLTRQDDTRKRQEIEKTKLSVIIKGVPIHKDVKDGEGETRKQTTEVMKNLLTQLDVANEISFPEIVRFKASEKSKGKGPELIKLTFSSTKHKAKLFEALAKAKDKGKKNIPKVSVTDEIPSFLREKQSKLEKLAYDIRQGIKSTKTRIFFKGTSIVLKCKKEGETAFSEVDDEGNPIPSKPDPKKPSSKSSTANSR